MKVFILALLAINSLVTYADSYRVVEILEAEGEKDLYTRVFLDNGEIIQIDSKDALALAKIREALSTGKSVEFNKISHNLKTPDIISEVKLGETLNEAAKPKEMFNQNRFNQIQFSTQNPLENSRISRLSSYNDAQDIMDDMNRRTRDKSQCYNRAHMWTYETLIQSQVSLGKIWLFFTRKYIRDYNYKWWFHVAPYTEVNDSNNVYVLDKGFTSVPYNQENWKDLFMRNKAHCPEITSYSEYENNPEEEYCYLMKSSQYYWQPYQLENLAEKNWKTWGYQNQNLEIAYRDALISWNGIIPEFPSDITIRDEVANEDVLERDVNQPIRGSEPAYTPVEDSSNRIGEYSSELVAGSRVIDNNDDDTGRVVRLISGNRLIFYSDKYRKEYDLPASRFSLKVLCYRDLCERDRVLDTNDNDQGTIREVFENGKVVFYSQKYSRNYTLRASRFSKESQCYGRICTGDRVLDTNDNDRGRIVKAFENGKVLFASDKYNQNYVLSASRFSLKTQCIGSICEGSSVRDTRDNDTGRVVEVFENGKIVFYSNDYRRNYVLDASRFVLR
ncbi:MAG: hypothetical protein CME65_02820 [Halobacteriovoraceae bacterium]|nr:hypothetical protein [Halobacteriovoraceae bacterium]|tara:strand:- start:695 stop:2374 length:1680 start_codon:yes stop_codon:yes gene_type:complete